MKVELNTEDGQRRLVFVLVEPDGSESHVYYAFDGNWDRLMSPVGRVTVTGPVFEYMKQWQAQQSADLAPPPAETGA